MYQWELRNAPDPQEVTSLSQALNVSQENAYLLVQRGIKTYEQAKAFFRPSLSALHNPFLMKDMDKAVERLQRAIQNKESILIYGDYDVDGTTSVALMYSFLKPLACKLLCYIPDRMKEGYGISEQGIDYAQQNNCTLIIALDCGIKGNEAVDYASKKGIDFIICDHHIQGEELPQAYAVLDPKRHDCTYPDKNLSGCGVGFKLVQAYAQTQNWEMEKITPLLDLVVVSIASDIVPIIGENRILAYWGLKRLNSSPRVGLEALIPIENKQKIKLNISDIVFKIAPKINAAGRLETASMALYLLLEEDAAKADLKAQEIITLNEERRALNESITEEIIQKIDANDDLKRKKTTVLYHSDWHKGVIGIVASKVIETHYKPTVIFSEKDGVLVGSARSVKGFDLYQAISACSDYLEVFGGHKYAAGLTIKKENFQAFSDAFETYAQAHLTPDMLIPTISIDTRLDLNRIDNKFFNILSQMAPFGPDNPRPVFVSYPLVDTGGSRLVGANQQHLKLSVCSEDTPQKKFDGIAFNQSKAFKIVENEPFKLCYQLNLNTFRGRSKIELSVKDIQALD